MAPESALYSDRVTTKVGQHELKYAGSQEEYVAFEVSSTPKMEGDEQFPEQVLVWRRYSDFELLAGYLNYMFPFCIIPPLPEKKVNFKLDKMQVDKTDEVFLQKRRFGLQTFIDRCSSDLIMGQSAILGHFLATQKWRPYMIVEKGLPANSHAHAPGPDGKQPTQWRVDGMAGAKKLLVRAKVPDRRFQELVGYANALEENLTSVLNKHGELANKLASVLSQYNRFGESLADIGELETNTAALDVSSAVGHQFDSMASGGYNLMVQEEAMFSDPLKEYVFYGESIRTMCHNQLVVHQVWETAEAAVEDMQKTIEKTKKPEGISGFFATWGTGGDQRAIDAKVQKLEAQLEILKEKRAIAEQETMEFNEKCLASVERFNAHKEKDVRAWLLQYAKIRKEWCRRMLARFKDMTHACSPKQ